MASEFPDGFEIMEVTSSHAIELEHARGLMRAHAGMLLELGVDIAAFQNFEAELALLPGKYAPAFGGRLYVLYSTTAASPVVSETAAAPAAPIPARTPAGTIAFHKINESTAELKRLYVNPAFRGLRLGEALSTFAIRCVSLTLSAAGKQALLL